MDALDFEEVIDRKRYSTKTATLIAHNCFWDGSNWERNGRNTWLYKTKNGNYFSVNRSQWQGERDSLLPIDQDEAIDIYEALQEYEVEFEEAFPGVEVREA
jgi:hypothetical protein